MMNRSKQEWIDYVWNPVTGCLRKCEYCYEYPSSRRFSSDVRYNKGRTDCYEKDGDVFILNEKFCNTTGGVLNFPFGFEPTYHKYRMDVLDVRKQTANILVCSDGELFGPWIPDWIITDVFEACDKYPNHNYFFLTQYPGRYEDLIYKKLLPEKENMWYGTTITNWEDRFFWTDEFNTFICIEPMLDDFEKEEVSEGMIDGFGKIKWIVIGAETGNRRGKVIPKSEWITKIATRSSVNNVPVFMKDSLIPIVGEDNMKREYPAELMNKKMGAALKRKLYGKCNWCSKEYRKNEMITLLGRRVRGVQPKQFGRICEFCFEDLCIKKNIEIPEGFIRRDIEDGEN